MVPALVLRKWQTNGIQEETINGWDIFYTCVLFQLTSLNVLLLNSTALSLNFLIMCAKSIKQICVCINSSAFQDINDLPWHVPRMISSPPFICYNKKTSFGRISNVYTYYIWFTY